MFLKNKNKINNGIQFLEKYLYKVYCNRFFKEYTGSFLRKYLNLKLNYTLASTNTTVK